MAENGFSERFDRIENRLDALSDSVDRRFEQVDARLAQVDVRLAQAESHFADIHKQFLEVRDHFVEQREYTDLAYERLNKRMTEGFTRLERKLDQLIDTRSRPTAAARRRPRPSKRRR